MAIISQAEDAVMNQVKSALTARVRSIETLSGPWTMPALKRALQLAPCVRIAFLGGKGSDADDAAIHARFGVYFITGQVDDKKRRRGTTRTIGIYDMLERVAPALNEFTIADIGTLTLDDVKPLFTEQTFQLGGSVYAAMFTLQNMVLPPIDGSAALNDFTTFHAESQLDADAEPELITEEVLPNA